jgi:hypothetical protein
MTAIGISLLALTSTPPRAADGDWTDRIDFKGDLRLRYERIDEEFEEDRNRMRFRARFGFSADVQDNVKVIVRLATGGDDPVSTNQTFDDGFSSKDISLDLAYVDWTVNDALSVSAGKIKTPFFNAGKVPLAWDGDLNLEGIAASYRSGPLFATAGGFSVEERSSADDSLLYVLQGGTKFTLGDTTKLTTGVGYSKYSNTIGAEPFYDGSAKGNTVDAGGNYVFDYENVEFFAQMDTKVNDWALQVFAHYTRNTEVSREDTAYAFGAKLGSAKSEGDMEFALIYGVTEADAIIATYNDSDFGGGGTDNDGFLLKAKYGLSDKIFLAGTFMQNDTDAFQGIEHDYNRLQLDIEFKFD